DILSSESDSHPYHFTGMFVCGQSGTPVPTEVRAADMGVLYIPHTKKQKSRLPENFRFFIMHS
ncbi:MAG: hypothetical protein IJ037_00200, partial [Clostridia bacterium]|nr:hypothetical protein [Clostridia bacterium]